MQNVHERVIAAPIGEVGPLLDSLGSRQDRLWPLPPRDPMILRTVDASGVVVGTGVAVGASGGHGPVRYVVEEHIPGRRVVFRFRGPLPLDGTHVLTADPAPGGGTVLRHVIDAVPRRHMRLLWPLLVRSMHDCYLEDAFDRAEQQLGVGPAREHRHSRMITLLESRLRRHVRSTAPLLAGAGAGALPRIDTADAFSTDLVQGDGTDPTAWTADIFGASPPWVGFLMRVRHVLMRPFGVVTAEGAPSALFPVHSTTPTELVAGIDDKHLDFRVVVTVDDAAARVTLTTVVHIHSTLGRLYWGVVRHVHPAVVRSLMRRAPYPAGHGAGVRVEAGAGVAAKLAADVRSGWGADGAR